MLQRVNAGNKSLADYRSIIRRELYAELQGLSERLKGARVLHVNATSFGGGVAEILYTLVPLMRDVGRSPFSTSQRASTMLCREPHMI